LTVAQLLLGDDTTMQPLLLRGLVVGAAIGAAQAALLRGIVPTPTIWAAIVTVGWPLGWAVTAAFGINLAEKWAVFGTFGALTFQLATGLTLAYLLRQSVRPPVPVHERGPVAAAGGS
jgi:hypothetical protein